MRKGSTSTRWRIWTALLVVLAAAILGMTRPGASWGASFDPAGDLPATPAASVVAPEAHVVSVEGAAFGARRSITCWKPGSSWD